MIIKLILDKLETGNYTFPNVESILEQRKSDVLDKIRASLDKEKTINEIIEGIEQSFSGERTLHKVEGYTLHIEDKVKGEQTLFFNIMDVLNDSIEVKINTTNFEAISIPTKDGIRIDFIVKIRLWEWLKKLVLCRLYNSIKATRIKHKDEYN